jgi:hypothetical protein
MTLFPVLQQRPRVSERARRIYRGDTEAAYGGLCAIGGDRTNLDNELHYLPLFTNMNRGVSDLVPGGILGHFQSQLAQLSRARGKIHDPIRTCFRRPVDKWFAYGP